MSLNPSLPPKRVFHFSVDHEGKFTYTPSDGWHYHRDEIVRFESPSGNFTINFIPLTMPAAPDYVPLRGPLTSERESSNLYAVETTVVDDLDEPTRAAIKATNISPENPEGFMGLYRYAIVMRDEMGRQTAVMDDTKNGQYQC